MSTAGVLIIGNEVLSGKVEEQNAKFLIGALREEGVRLERLVFIRDEIDIIAREVAEMSSAYDHVFTSGGVGATHDDLTFEGVAEGLRVPLVPEPFLMGLLEKHYGQRMNEAVRRMAMVPEGTVLLGQEELLYPIVSVRNIYVLPGVPQFLREKFNVLRPRLGGRPFFLQQLFVNVGEDRLADLLSSVQDQFPDLEIGSYPRFDAADHRVRITVEARDEALVERAAAALVEGFEPGWLVRRDEGGS